MYEHDDCFNGNEKQFSRGTRYDIVADGHVVYHDVTEKEADYLCDEMSRKPWLYENIECVELK